MHDLPETLKLEILMALRKPATMALVLLERHATHPAALDYIRASEALGKGRWQVLNQAKMWQAADSIKKIVLT